MKKIKMLLSILIIITLVFSMTACKTTDAIYKPGTYEGEGQGHGGTIKVAVTVNETKIEKVDLVENPESEFSLDAINKVIDEVVEKNTAEVDTVSGATETTTGLIDAIKAAVAKATSQSEALEDVTTDVVVIGAGGAGLSAAVEAYDNGAKVLVLEKMPIVGGNTNYATGGLNASQTKSQEDLSIEDSNELFFEDTMKGGKNINNPDLVNVLVNNSSNTVAWLTELGADLTDVGRAGGASVNRIHRPTGGAPVGNHLVQVLYNNVQDKGIEVRTENKVVEILADNGQVNGVKVETPEGNYNVYAKAVVIASGGFGNSPEKIVEYKPELEGFGTTNHPGATGDALDLVNPLNVALVDIEHIQTHPTVVPEKNKMITEAVRGNGAILVNRDGKRFIDELETRDVVSEAELAQEAGTAFLIFDQGVRESLSAIEKYAKAGLLTEASTIEELAEAIGVDGATLKSTISTYNGYVDAQDDKDFARDYMPLKLEKAPYYMVEVGPAVHHTMGGIEINTETQVINENGEIVEGLFAAGEVTGGVHGANRLGGNALSDITTFGRIAGANAAKYSVE